MSKTFGAGLLGVLATLLAAVAVWLAVVYTGAYNVAASDPHLDAARWTLDTTMQRSVSRRAGDVPPVRGGAGVCSSPNQGGRARVVRNLGERR